MSTWNQLVPMASPGVRVSNPQAFGVVGSVKTLTPTIHATVPSGASCSVELAYALDGVTYGAWTALVSGTPVATLTGDLTSASRFKIRVTLTAVDISAYPTFDGLDLLLEPLLCADGYWLSPVVTQTFYAQSPTGALTREVGNTYGTAVLQFRYRESADADWSEWEAVDPDIPSQHPYVQFKVALTAETGRLQSPKVTKASTTYDYTQLYGTWLSPSIDMTQTPSKSNSRVTFEAALGTAGRVEIMSRSRTSALDTWSAWHAKLPDGTLTHPANNIVQLLLLIIGTAEVKRVSFLADGEAEAQEILSGMAYGAEYDFTTLKDMLIIVNGAEFPYKWDAVMASPQLLGGSPPALKMVETHQNRVWGVEVENPSRLRFSDILVPETWPAFNFFDFNPEDGDSITACFRYGQNLMVSKLRSMAMLTGNSSANYAMSWMDFGYGATGPRAMCATDKYLAYVATDGVRFSDLVTSVLATERLQPDWARINQRRLNQAAVVYYRNMLLVALPKDDSLVNNTVWVFDSLRSSWAIYDGWCVSAWCLFTEFGRTTLLATDSTTGNVREVFVGLYDDDVRVDYLWRTREMAFKKPERYKLFRNIFLDVEGSGTASDLTMRMYVDGESTPRGEVSYHLASGEKRSIHVMPPVHNVILGRTLTLEFEGNAMVKSYTVEYSVKGTIPQEDV